MAAALDFDKELFALTESRLPVSASKITSLAKSAIKLAKHYKNVVYAIEKFVQRCRAEYKLAGLYVVDAILNASIKRLPPSGSASDGPANVYVRRFEEKLESIFNHLVQGPSASDKDKMRKVVLLWDKNGLFNHELLQIILQAYFSSANASSSSTPAGAASPAVRNAKDVSNEHNSAQSAITAAPEPQNQPKSVQNHSETHGKQTAAEPESIPAAAAAQTTHVPSAASASSEPDVSQPASKPAQLVDPFNFDYGDEDEWPETSETPTASSAVHASTAETAQALAAAIPGVLAAVAAANAAAASANSSAQNQSATSPSLSQSETPISPDTLASSISISTSQATPLIRSSLVSPSFSGLPGLQPALTSPLAPSSANSATSHTLPGLQSNFGSLPGLSPFSGKLPGLSGGLATLTGASQPSLTPSKADLTDADAARGDKDDQDGSSSNHRSGTGRHTERFSRPAMRPTKSNTANKRQALSGIGKSSLYGSTSKSDARNEGNNNRSARYADDDHDASNDTVLVDPSAMDPTEDDLHANLFSVQTEPELLDMTPNRHRNHATTHRDHLKDDLSATDAMTRIGAKRSIDAVDDTSDLYGDISG